MNALSAAHSRRARSVILDTFIRMESLVVGYRTAGCASVRVHMSRHVAAPRAVERVPVGGQAALAARANDTIIAMRRSSCAGSEQLPFIERLCAV
ncbi:hypothetical protein [Paraburkholderia sp. Ac-20347]|uniref:hypothetical protein n=1 Tax=Paraburkholderia sp. Ac-20347 TaxID=2703892 RepID=UPI001981CBAA|nr:hypothetical protein [Paraburkholderia sp. Ac-20347]MBN3809282.1 hypothetical protein [Paraburkholderia sp. Ac-20347]